MDRAEAFRCANCRRWFKTETTRKTCSRSCAVALSWRNPEVKARRGAAISAAKLTEKGRADTARSNRDRWARPGEKEKLAQQNRREWKIAGEKRARSIKAAWGPKQRAHLSAIRKRQWTEPEFRNKVIAAATASQRTQAYRAHFSEALKARWADPVWRAKYVAANRRRNADPAYQAIRSNRMKALWKDPEFREKQRVAMKRKRRPSDG